MAASAQFEVMRSYLGESLSFLKCPIECRRSTFAFRVFTAIGISVVLS